MDTTRWGEGFPAGGTDAQDNKAQPADPRPETNGAERDPDPFDEPEAAPELVQQRSANVYTRSTPFWERVVELPVEGEEYEKDPGYWDHPEEIREDVIMRVEQEKFGERVRRHLSNRTTLLHYAIVLLVLGVALFLFSAAMTVKSIRVEGSTRFTDEEVIALSGLKLGMHSFSIDEETVMERIGRERYLRCTLVDVSADTVTLHVRERVPVATIVQNGRRIILDERGWVLEISDDMHTIPEGLVNVLGLDVQHCSIGQGVTLRVPDRLQTYMQILVELRALGGLELIVELDMTTMDSITLKTEDDMTVLLGNELGIHEKIRAFLVVRENLILNGFYGKGREGTIVVSDPTSPAYTPPGVGTAR